MNKLLALAFLLFGTSAFAVSPRPKSKISGFNYCTTMGAIGRTSKINVCLRFHSVAYKVDDETPKASGSAPLQYDYKFAYDDNHKLYQVILRKVGIEPKKYWISENLNCLGDSPEFINSFKRDREKDCQ